MQASSEWGDIQPSPQCKQAVYDRVCSTVLPFALQQGNSASAVNAAMENMHIAHVDMRAILACTRRGAVCSRSCFGHLRGHNLCNVGHSAERMLHECYCSWQLGCALQLVQQVKTYRCRQPCTGRSRCYCADENQAGSSALLDVLEFSPEELHLRFSDTMPQIAQAAVQVMHFGLPCCTHTGLPVNVLSQKRGIGRYQ